MNGLKLTAIFVGVFVGTLLLFALVLPPICWLATVWAHYWMSLT